MAGPGQACVRDEGGVQRPSVGPPSMCPAGGLVCSSTLARTLFKLGAACVQAPCTSPQLPPCPLQLPPKDLARHHSPHLAHQERCASDGRASSSRGLSGRRPHNHAYSYSLLVYACVQLYVSLSLLQVSPALALARGMASRTSNVLGAELVGATPCRGGAPPPGMGITLAAASRHITWDA